MIGFHYIEIVDEPDETFGFLNSGHRLWPKLDFQTESAGSFRRTSLG